MIDWNQPMYAREYHQVFSQLSLPEKIDRFEWYRQRLYYNNPNKNRYYAILINALYRDKELNERYELDDDARRWANRIKLKAKRTIAIPIVQFRPCECYEEPIKNYLDISGQDFAGLYFVQCTWADPVNEFPIYGVKIGQSSTSVSERLKGYTTANPFTYHKAEWSIPFAEYPQANEKKCHTFLRALAVQTREGYDGEWFIVNKETYFKLAEFFSNPQNFAAVATGMVK